MNHRTRPLCALSAVATLVAAVPAFAANPVAGSRYAGQTSQPGALRLEFSTSANGKRVEKLLAQFVTPKCVTSSSGTQGTLRPRPIAIVGNRFSTHGKEIAKLRKAGSFKGGSQVERYRISGHFPDVDTARGTLKVTVEVRDKTGKQVDSCTTKRTIRWSADRLGVGPETEE
jgi:hypothetical protein